MFFTTSSTGSHNALAGGVFIFWLAPKNEPKKRGKGLCPLQPLEVSGSLGRCACAPLMRAPLPCFLVTSCHEARSNTRVWRRSARRSRGGLCRRPYHVYCTIPTLRCQWKRSTILQGVFCIFFSHKENRRRSHGSTAVRVGITVPAVDAFPSRAQCGNSPSRWGSWRSGC